jgi:hypothetical protein
MFQQVMGPVAQSACWKILLGGRAFEPRICYDYAATCKTRRVLDVQTSYYCRYRLQPERMYQHFAQAKYHFIFPTQQLRVLSSRPLSMTNCNGRYRAYNLYLQSHLSCSTRVLPPDPTRVMNCVPCVGQPVDVCNGRRSVRECWIYTAST